MGIEVIHLLDPELVVPSVESAQKLEFWSRVMAWSTVSEMRIGPSTLRALAPTLSCPPVVPGLASPDFWTIIAKVTGRNLEKTGSRKLCETHMRDRYTPRMGAEGNLDVLLADLSVIASDRGVALGTSDDCWSPAPSCELCETTSPSLVGSHADPVYLRAVAQAWRQEYLLRGRGDFDLLKALTTEMFPLIEFAKDAWDHIGKLPSEVGAKHIVEHLGVLSDHAQDVWAERVNTADREAALGSYGVSASPESPQTHKNAAAMKARDFRFSDGVVRCEWHTKILPQAGRIYFAVQPHDVKVGTITDHLLT